MCPSMLPDLIVPFVTVGLAEIADKSQLVLITLSARYKQHGRVFLGVVLGFILAQAVAVLLGKTIEQFIPDIVQRILVSLIFIGFGLYILFREHDVAVKVKDHKPFLTAFSLIFLTEMGDKTQIATMLFAAEYNPWLVFLSTVLVLCLVSLGSIFVGKRIVKYLHIKTIHTITGILFLLLAIVPWIA